MRDGPARGCPLRRAAPRCAARRPTGAWRCSGQSPARSAALVIISAHLQLQRLEVLADSLGFRHCVAWCAGVLLGPDALAGRAQRPGRLGAARAGRPIHAAASGTHCCQCASGLRQPAGHRARGRFPVRLWRTCMIAIEGMNDCHCNMIAEQKNQLVLQDPATDPA